LNDSCPFQRLHTKAESSYKDIKR